jgi:hypothetical protein
VHPRVNQQRLRQQKNRKERVHRGSSAMKPPVKLGMSNCNETATDTQQPQPAAASVSPQACRQGATVQHPKLAAAVLYCTRVPQHRQPYLSSLRSYILVSLPHRCCWSTPSSKSSLAACIDHSKYERLAAIRHSSRRFCCTASSRDSRSHRSAPEATDAMSRPAACRGARDARRLPVVRRRQRQLTKMRD